jgi:hypothetical protein
MGKASRKYGEINAYVLLVGELQGGDHLGHKAEDEMIILK